MAEVKQSQKQGLKLHHFDTKTGDEITEENEPEIIKHSLAEYFASYYDQEEVEFKIGVIDPRTTEVNDLTKHGDQSLQFSSGDRFFFSNKDNLRDQIFPNPSDGAAYGSNVFTECNSFCEIEDAKVLIIDDETGANGIGLDAEEAKKLVDDCYGFIDKDIHKQMGNPDNTPFQFRLGTNPQENDPVHRLGKGTVAPRDIKKKLEEQGINEPLDIILPKSSFKGRKGEENNEIKPGIYNWDLGIGNKTNAYANEQALGTQVLGFFPETVTQEVKPIIEKKLATLEEHKKDPRILAQDYIESEEKRKKAQEEKTQNNDGTNLSLESIKIKGSEEDLTTISSVLQADEYSQLLEHPKIAETLIGYLQGQYKDAATGRALKFKGALIQPHPELKEGEICVPNEEEGAELITLRSPVINSNGVIVRENKYLEDTEAIQDKGVIFMNPQDAARALQADFDGDRAAYERADKYPEFTKEIKKRQLPENRYPDIEKKDKVPYEGSFEEIALSQANAAANIGSIANQLMKAEALRIECSEASMSPTEKREFLKEQISNINEFLLENKEFKTVIDSNDDQHSKDIKEKNKIITQDKNAQKIIETMQGVTNERKVGNPSTMTDEQVDKTLALISRDIYKNNVALLGNQLQIAVDGPKSSLRPEPGIVNFSKGFLNKSRVSALEERKKENIYSPKTSGEEAVIGSNRHGPLDELVQMTNEYYQAGDSLDQRYSRQFQPLFPKVNDANIKKEAKKLLLDFREINGERIDTAQQAKNQGGYEIQLTTTGGYDLKVYRENKNFTEEHGIKLSDGTQEGKKLEVTLYPPKRERGETEWSVTARPERSEKQVKKVGNLTPISKRKLVNNDPNIEKKINDHEKAKKPIKTTVTVGKIYPPTSEAQVKAKTKKVTRWTETQRQKLDQRDPKTRFSLAAAIWHEENKRNTEKFSIKLKNSSFNENINIGGLQSPYNLTFNPIADQGDVNLFKKQAKEGKTSLEFKVSEKDEREPDKRKLLARPVGSKEDWKEAGSIKNFKKEPQEKFDKRLDRFTTPFTATPQENESNTTNHYSQAILSFRLFSPEIVGQLSEPKVAQIKGNQVDPKIFDKAGEEVEVTIGRVKNEDGEWDKTLEIDGDLVGFLYKNDDDPKTGEYPIGTKAIGIVEPEKVSSLTLTYQDETGEAIDLWVTKLNNPNLDYKTFEGQDIKVKFGEERTFKGNGNSTQAILAIYTEDNERIGAIEKKEGSDKAPDNIKGIKSLEKKVGQQTEYGQHPSLKGIETTVSLQQNHSSIATISIDTGSIELPQTWKKVTPHEPVSLKYSDQHLNVKISEYHDSTEKAGAYAITPYNEQEESITEFNQGAKKEGIKLKKQLTLKGVKEAIELGETLNGVESLTITTNQPDLADQISQVGQWKENNWRTAEGTLISKSLQEDWESLYEKYQSTDLEINFDYRREQERSQLNQEGKKLAQDIYENTKVNQYEQQINQLFNSETITEQTELPKGNLIHIETTGDNETTLNGNRLEGYNIEINEGWAFAEKSEEEQYILFIGKEGFNNDSLKEFLEDNKIKLIEGKPYFTEELGDEKGNPVQITIYKGSLIAINENDIPPEKTSKSELDENQQKIYESVYGHSPQNNLEQKESAPQAIEKKSATQQKPTKQNTTTVEQPQKEEAIKVVNRHSEKEDKYIGRGSPLGNPFPLSNKGSESERENSIKGYKQYLFQITKGKTPEVAAKQVSKANNLQISPKWQAPDQEKVFKELSEIEEKSQTPGGCKLGCFCKPKACHGDTVKSLIESNYWQGVKKQTANTPQPQEKPQKKENSIIISSDTKNLGGALANNTEDSRSKGNIKNSYPVVLGGKRYESAEHAHQENKDALTEVLQAKLEQHPKLTTEIQKRGGSQWLQQAKDENGATGKESPFIQALTTAYENTIEKTKNLTVKQVISGGQTGADRGGLEAAKQLGIPTGGTAPKNFKTEKGNDPSLKAFNLTADQRLNYTERTEENIKNSDGTILFGDPKSAGSRATLNAAQKHSKPLLVIENPEGNQTTEQINNFLADHNIQTLNIAGNRESKNPGIEDNVKNTLVEALNPQQSFESPLNKKESLFIVTPKNTIEFTPLQGKEDSVTEESQPIGIDKEFNIYLHQENQPEKVGKITDENEQNKINLKNQDYATSSGQISSTNENFNLFNTEALLKIKSDHFDLEANPLQGKENSSFQFQGKVTINSNFIVFKTEEKEAIGQVSNNSQAQVKNKLSQSRNITFEATIGNELSQPKSIKQERSQKKKESENSLQQ